MRRLLDRRDAAQANRTATLALTDCDFSDLISFMTAELRKKCGTELKTASWLATP
jgi:hypothetical protein